MTIIGENSFHNTSISTISIPEGITRYECKVPMIIKNIMKQEGIECPNYYNEQTKIQTKTQTKGKNSHQNNRNNKRGKKIIIGSSFEVQENVVQGEQQSQPTGHEE